MNSERRKTVLLLLPAGLPLWINAWLAWDMWTTLHLTGASAAQGDWSFYTGLWQYGTAACVLSLLGLVWCVLCGCGKAHVAVIVHTVNTLLPFIWGFTFDFFWP